MIIIIAILFSTGCAAIAYFLGVAINRWLLPKAANWLPIVLASVTWVGMTDYNWSLLYHDVHDQHGVIRPRHIHDTIVHHGDLIVDSLISIDSAAGFDTLK